MLRVLGMSFCLLLMLGGCQKKEIQTETVDVSGFAGQVIDDQGKPVSGVTLRLVNYNRSGRKSVPFSWEYFMTGVPEKFVSAMAETVSDSRGHFQFDLEPQEPSDLFLIGDDWAHKVVALDTEQTTSFVLERGGSISGKINRERIKGKFELVLANGRHPRNVVINKDEDQYRFSNLGAGSYQLIYRMGSRTPFDNFQARTIELKSGEQVVAGILMEKGVRLKIALDVGGEPFANVYCALQKKGKNGEPIQRRQADGDGVVSFKNVTAGTYRLYVGRTEQIGLPTKKNHPYVHDLTIGDKDVFREVLFERLAQVSGVVKGLGKGFISANHESGSIKRCGMNEKGEFHLKDLSPGLYRMYWVGAAWNPGNEFLAEVEVKKDDINLGVLEPKDD